MENRMRAALTKQYKHLSIEELERPVPSHNEILIRVEATTVNRTDCHNLSGEPFIMRLMLGLKGPRRFVQGTDFAGVVEAVGKSVTKFSVGDRLFGFNDMGLSSNAEYLTVTENTPLAPIPEKVSSVDAVATIEGFHYALNFLNKVHLQKGDAVLINGGTGAIGAALLQLCRLAGARISVTCRTEHKELMQELGAERVIDYTTEDFTESRDRFQFVFDAVGKSSFGACKPLLTERGVYISSELGKRSENLFLSIRSMLLGKKKVKFPIPTNIQKSLEEVALLLSSGDFKALIDRSYTLDEIASAYAYAESGEKVGSLIVKMGR